MLSKKCCEFKVLRPKPPNEDRMTMIHRLSFMRAQGRCSFVQASDRETNSLKQQYKRLF